MAFWKKRIFNGAVFAVFFWLLTAQMPPSTKAQEDNLTCIYGTGPGCPALPTSPPINTPTTVPTTRPLPTATRAPTSTPRPTAAPGATSTPAFTATPTQISTISATPTPKLLPKSGNIGSIIAVSALGLFLILAAAFAF